jgi:ABC-2 type transport system permease protein
MNQITATFTKTIKGFLRNRAVLFWTIAWPVILLIILNLTALHGVPDGMVPFARGEVTISMVIFALTLAGMSNLASNIARDREDGLLTKLKSMPVSAGLEFCGRVLALFALSILTATIVTVIGVALGARFNLSAGLPQAAGFLLLIIGCSAGIGLIIGSLVHSIQGAMFTGVGISVVASFLSGIFIPYSSLPDFLKSFAQIYPIASAGSSASYYLLGEAVTGYNPLSEVQVITTIILSLALLGTGIFLYSKLSWKRD